MNEVTEAKGLGLAKRMSVFDRKEVLGMRKVKKISHETLLDLLASWEHHPSFVPVS